MSVYLTIHPCDLENGSAVNPPPKKKKKKEETSTTNIKRNLYHITFSFSCLFRGLGVGEGNTAYLWYLKLSSITLD